MPKFMNKFFQKNCFVHKFENTFFPVILTKGAGNKKNIGSIQIN